MPPGKDVGMGLTKGGGSGVMIPGSPDNGGVVAGEVDFDLGGERLLDRSSRGDLNP